LKMVSPRDTSHVRTAHSSDQADQHEAAMDAPSKFLACAANNSVKPA
jgi:hypothetical protein